MISTMEYKGYIGSVEYSPEDEILFGKVQFINSLVSYEGNDVKSLKKGFEYMVDEYLNMCSRKKIEPEKPFKGSFNVRVEPELHRSAARIAKQEGVTLNHLVAGAIKEYINNHA